MDRYRVPYVDSLACMALGLLLVIGGVAITVFMTTYSYVVNVFVPGFGYILFALMLMVFLIRDCVRNRNRRIKKYNTRLHTYGPPTAYLSEDGDNSPLIWKNSKN